MTFSLEVRPCHHTYDGNGNLIKITDCNKNGCPTSDTNPDKRIPEKQADTFLGTGNQ